MPLNLTELSKAVSAVAGIAQAHAAMKADVARAQADVDTLTASLLAAVSTPAEAVGIAAVAAALAEPTAPADAAPVATASTLPSVSPVASAIAHMDDMLAGLR